MSNPSQAPWSDNPFAPKIPYALYLGEKVYFAGVIVGSVLYGIVIVLFFLCMGALFDTTNRARGGISWGFVVHTVAMFTFATLYISMASNIQSISFIDNRNFPASVNGVPGPVGYQFYIHSRAIGIAPTPMILLNGWLGDLLLLYRCYILYAKSYKALIIPCVLYLGSVASGILFTYKITRPDDVPTSVIVMLHFGAPYFSISFASNIVLTLMIVVRLVLHRRNLRKAIGTGTNVGGLYQAILAIFVESYAIAAITLILFIGTWAAKSYVQYIFLVMLTQVQVIAPFLVTLRVANRRALTSEAITTGNIGSIHFRTRGKPTSTSGTMNYPMDSTDASELGVGVDTKQPKDLGSP